MNSTDDPTTTGRSTYDAGFRHAMSVAATLARDMLPAGETLDAYRDALLERKAPYEETVTNAR